MSELSPMLAWIDSQADRMRRLVIEWANVNSHSYNVAGLSTMVEMLREAFAPLGGEVEVIPLPDEHTIDAAGNMAVQPLGKALRIRKRTSAPFRLFFCIHSDTVYPADSAFQSCRLIDDNTLRGPGVADAKGGLAVMLVAAEALERSALAESIGWEILINPDEEIGSPGSSPLFDQAARRNDVGILFEPAFGAADLVGERGGSGSYSIAVRGRSAHAGRDPHAGRNAMHAVAEMVVAIAGLQTENVTINVARIDGGGPVNVVPDLAIARLNVRVKTPQDRQTIVTRLEALVAEFGRRDGFRAELHGGFHRPPKPLDAFTRRLLDAALSSAAELGLTIGVARSGGVSDGNQLAAAGLPNLDSLGPRGGKIHSPDEFLLLDSLTERAKLTTLLVEKLVREAGAPCRE